MNGEIEHNKYLSQKLKQKVVDLIKGNIENMFIFLKESNFHDTSLIDVSTNFRKRILDLI